MSALFRFAGLLVEPAARRVRRNMRFQTGGGFQPVVDIVTGRAVALPIKVIGILPDRILTRLLDGGRREHGQVFD